MNDEAKEAFKALPHAIDNFEEEIDHAIRSDTNHLNYGWLHICNKSGQTLWPWNLACLLSHYKLINFITEGQLQDLTKQLQSYDKESWLVAFVVIDALKYRNKNDEKKPKK